MAYLPNDFEHTNQMLEQFWGQPCSAGALSSSDYSSSIRSSFDEINTLSASDYFFSAEPWTHDHPPLKSEGLPLAQVGPSPFPCSVSANWSQLRLIFSQNSDIKTPEFDTGGSEQHTRREVESRS